MMLRAALAAVLLVPAATLTGSLPACAGEAPARVLTVALPRGMIGLDLQRAVLDPFAATGTPVHTASGPSGADSLEDAAAQWDVVAISAAGLEAACAGGKLEKLDWTALGGRDRQSPPGASDCGLGAFVAATALSWDRAKFPGTPTWQDFWDIAKVPGKRGLERSPRGTLEIALLADGVAPGDVYRLLRTEDGVARAFRKLDQLAPYIDWWTSGARDAAHLLGSGEVLMSSAPVASVVAANHAGHNFGLQWAGGLAEAQYWAIPKGAPDLVASQRFLAFAADPAHQKLLPEEAGLGGLARGANDGLSPEAAALSPTANPAGLLFIDEGFWRDNGEKLAARFDAWVPR